MISVVIPAYNAEQCIGKAIESIANQTRAVDEIIVVNDGSTDNTVEVITQIIKGLSVDIRIINQENSGPSKARNRGIKESKGDWVAFLDADDIWEKEKIQKQMEQLESHAEYAVVGSLLEFSTINSNRAFEKIKFSDLLIKNKVFTSTVIARKNALIEAGGFREDMKYSEDYNLWLKLTKKHPVMVLNNRLVCYGGGKGVLSNVGLSSNMWAMQKGELSNFFEMYRLGYINLGKYLLLVIFSISKFIRRKILKIVK